jgi:regulatory protein
MWDPLHPEKTIRLIQRYCVYQDRSVHDVKEKMNSLGVPNAKAKSILDLLQEEKFIDDERFVRSFVHGKFRNNKWGRLKIAFALKNKGIPETIIREEIGNIDEDEYRSTLITLITRKRKEIKAEKNLNVRQKIVNFALGKGYEMPLILDSIKEMKLDL